MVSKETRKATRETPTKAILCADWDRPIIFPCTSLGADREIRFTAELMENTAKNPATANTIENRVKTFRNCIRNKHPVITAKPNIPILIVEYLFIR